VAALAYLLPPISGALAFFLSADERVRFHGLQSVAIGAAWPGLLYGASTVSATATQLTFVLGLVVWLGSLIVTALGRDARVPVVGKALARAAGLSEPRH
jgi:uncharacterized membrane protein